MKITGINYLALGLKGNKQLGGDESSSEKINLNDGLSVEELKLTDTNKDGTVTLEEFQNKFGSKDNAANDKFNDYLTLINYNKNNNTQQIGNKTVKSTYDKNGKLSGYTETVADSQTGAKTINEYTVTNGKATKISTKKVYLDGSTEEKSLDGKTLSKSANGISVSVKNNKLTEVSNTDSKGNKEQINFSYNSKGKIVSVKINNGKTEKEYDNISYSKDGNTITIKDSEGNRVAKVKTSDEKVTIKQYSNGVVRRKFTLDKSDNFPISYKKYDANGNIKSVKNAQTGIIKKYSYNDNGQIESGTKYNADGKKISSYTFYTKDASTYYGNKTGALVKSKTNYDEEGNITGYKKYSYSTNDDKSSITKKVRTFPDLSTALLTQDSYGNTLFKYSTDSNGQKVSTEYTYDTALTKKVKTPLHYNTVTKNIGNRNIVESYDEGAISHKEVTTFKDGEGFTTKYDYEYFPKSDNTLSAKIMTDSNGNVTKYIYNTDGSYTKTYKDKNNNSVTAQCNANGIVSHKEVTDETGATTKYDYTYNENNVLTKRVRTDSNNNVVTYNYNEDGSYNKVYKDKNNNDVIAQCDKNGVVTHRDVTDAEGKTTHYDYEYNENNFLIKKVITDSDNKVTTYNYNEDGTSTKSYIDDNSNNIVEYYNENGKMTKKEEIDPNTNTVTTYEYNDDLSIVKTITDENGLITYKEVTDAENNVTSYVYEYDNGNLIKETITAPDNTVTVKEYNENGQLTKETITDKDNNITEKEYDENGQLTKETITDKDNTVTVKEYNENGQLTKETITDKDDNVTEKEYNENGQLTKVTKKDNEGNITITEYFDFDENGRYTKEKITEPNGNVMEYTYQYNDDDNTYTKAYIDNEGYNVLERYDSNDNKLSETKTNDNTIIATEYNEDGSYTVTTSDGSGWQKIEKYNKDAEKPYYIEETDTEGNTTKTEYSDFDEKGRYRKEVITNPEGNVTEYNYEYNDDDNTYTKSYKDIMGSSVVDKYDEYGHLLKKEETNPENEKFTYEYFDYDEYNHYKKEVVTDPEGNSTEYYYEYAEDGSFTKTYTDENGETVVEHYDQYGNRIDEETPAEG